MIAKKKNKTCRILLYGTLGVILLSTAVFGGVFPRGRGTGCCANSIECPTPGPNDPGTELICCIGTPNMPSCSGDSPGYCMYSC